jgi:hypothetical protein
LATRRASERERFLTKYGVDLDRLKNYDAVIDSTSASPEEVVSTIIACMEENRADRKPYLFLDPKRLVPVESLVNIGSEEGVDGAVATEGASPIGFVDADDPVGVGRNGHAFFIIDGQKRVISAIRAQRSLIRCRLVEEKEA